MAVIPSDNRQHIHQIVTEMLDHGRPDLRNTGRWVKVTVNANVSEPQLQRIADRLRDSGYHVSVMPLTIKVTKQDLDWPET
jgi:hypothetical protein